MTEKEMIEIFAVLLLAYPNAECFKGGKEQLLPTIKLWHRYCIDVDCHTAKQAVRRLIAQSKYPPTIAEFLAQVRDVNRADGAMECYLFIRNMVNIHGAELACSMLPSDYKRVVDAMGGPDKLFDASGKMFRMADIIQTYKETQIQKQIGGKQ